jgi:hypothetical protein
MAMRLRIDFHRHKTTWFIEKLSLYLDAMETSIKESRRVDQERIEQIPLESADDFDDRSEELHLLELLEKDFSSKLRYSFLILVYTMLEIRTKALWRELASRRMVGNREFEKGKKSHLASVRFYLSSEPKVACTDSRLWSELLNFEAIRHCLVHTGGNIDEMDRGKPEKLKKIVRNSEGLSISDDGYIEVESVYCRHILSEVDRFFDGIFEFAGFGPKDTVIEYK